jgi:L-lactate dehydrogenase complex protein LldG
MPGDARSEVLRRIRTALADRTPAAPVERRYRGRDVLDSRTPAQLADLLTERLADYKASVHRCDAADVPGTVAAVLSTRAGGRRLRVGRPHGLDPAWTVAARRVEFVPDQPLLGHAELDALDGVITTCAVAVAETGTVVLDCGPGQGRRALSLVPDYHLVVIPAATIVGSVPAAVARVDPRRPLTWISGPSATSDIELNRVEGVHGPRTLDVIIAV